MFEALLAEQVKILKTGDAQQFVSEKSLRDAAGLKIDLQSRDLCNEADAETIPSEYTLS